jgi:hypothetical protein
MSWANQAQLAFAATMLIALPSRACIHLAKCGCQDFFFYGTVWPFSSKPHPVERFAGNKGGRGAPLAGWTRREGQKNLLKTSLLTGELVRVYKVSGLIALSIR